jgi:hypothetical protein
MPRAEKTLPDTMMLPSRYVFPSAVPGRILLVTVRKPVLRVPTFA